MAEFHELHLGRVHPDCIIQDLRLERDRRQAAGEVMPRCNLWSEFYSGCGHFVTTRRCRNDNRLWVGETYQDPALCCDESCVAKELGPRMYPGLKCVWCEDPQRLPFTTSSRSDPQNDVLAPDDIERRYSFFEREVRQRARRRRSVASRRRGPENLLYLWRSYQARTQRIEEIFQRPTIDRIYFVGPYDDRQLFEPVTDLSRVGEDDICAICQENIRVPLPIKLPCDHLWHAGCIRTWFREHDSCPTCRRPFRILAFKDFEYKPEDSEAEDEYEECEDETEGSETEGSGIEGSETEDEYAMNAENMEDDVVEGAEFGGDEWEGYDSDECESEEDVVEAGEPYWCVPCREVHLRRASCGKSQ